MESNKMYVIVRRDLAPIYKMVQGSHALAKFAEEFPKLFREWGNGYLIFVEVANFLEMDKLLPKIKPIPVKSVWFEPDLGYQVTAICIPESHGFWCKDLPLASL